MTQVGGGHVWRLGAFEAASSSDGFRVLLVTRDMSARDRAIAITVPAESTGTQVVLEYLSKFRIFEL